MQFAGAFLLALTGEAYALRQDSSSLEYTKYTEQIEQIKPIKHKDLPCQLESTLAKGVIQA